MDGSPLEILSDGTESYFYGSLSHGLASLSLGACHSVPIPTEQSCSKVHTIIAQALLLKIGTCDDRLAHG